MEKEGEARDAKVARDRAAALDAVLGPTSTSKARVVLQRVSFFFLKGLLFSFLPFTPDGFFY